MNTHQLDVLKLALTWCDAHWDESIGLYLNPAHGSEPAEPMVRATAWYALGLLTRGLEPDRLRAISALENVLSYQWNRPGAPYHGTWARHPEEVEPGPEPKEWRDYDPNWREFIGLTLEIILVRHAGDLPASLVQGIERSLVLAVEGSLARGIRPHYTNIALMAAFLYDAGGRRFGNPSWSAKGHELTMGVWANFSLHDTFEEFNSPTYYGVDLIGLAALRSLAHDIESREVATRMEKALWAEMGQLYHARLRNFCGPYDRAYGMDLRSYVACATHWIALGVGLDEAPYPREPYYHKHDTVPACLISVLGVPDLPAQVLEAFTIWTGARELDFIIDQPGSRTATCVLEDNWMVGGDSRPGRTWSQRCPGTIHWRHAATGELCWLKFESSEHLTVRASRQGLRLSFLDHQAYEIVAYISCPSQTGSSLSDGELPGLPADFSLPPSRVEPVEDEDLGRYQLVWDQAAALEVNIRAKWRVC